MKTRSSKKDKLISIGGYFCDTPFFHMEHQEFIDYCGGRLAVSIFNGEMKQELSTIIAMANARGMKRMYDLEREEIKG